MSSGAESAMRVTCLPSRGYARMRWRNDGGWTSEVAREPAATDVPFDWRISIAEIERDGPFSPFPGCDRNITVLAGDGMELVVGRDATLLNQRGRPFAFDGEAPAHCRLLGGPTRDFNVMTRRDAFTQQVWFRPLVGPMVLLPEAGVTWIVHVAGGHAQRQHDAASARAEAGDTLRIDVGGAPGPPVVLGGAGELLLVKLTAISR